MIQTIRGLHHVTAIAIDPQANIDFYTQVLGLRLVKDTVNFDDPSTYHFYYGDKSGNPGTILTFFPFVSADRGRSGSGMVDTVAFAAPARSLDDWIVRLAERGVDVDGPFTRFSCPTIGFRDPDGLKLEIAAVDGLEPTDAARCPFRKSYPDVMVVQSGQDWDRDNGTGPLDCPTGGRVFAQRQMCADLIVVGRIRRKNLPQVRLAEDQHPVPALATYAANQALRIRILPW